MASLLSDLKSHARLLHRAAQEREPAALARLRALPDLKGLDDEALAAAAQRRHALAAVALELGFAGWPQAEAVFSGGPAEDFGTLLVPRGADAFWNVWSAKYEEARAIREQNQGVLLAYRRHFFLVERAYLAFLGTDPDDPDWEAIGRDWARPKDPAARERLYRKVIRARGLLPGLPEAGEA